MIGYISNTFGYDITIQPDAGQINLLTNVNASNITGRNITTPANTNLNITPGTNGSTNINSTLIVRDSLTVTSETISTNNNLSLAIGGQVQVAAGKTLTVDTINSTTTNGNLSLSANGTGTINLNSSVVGTTITATTFTAPPSTNLNINALGGSIITNAIRLAPTTSLTIAPATSLTFAPGSSAQFNCSVNVSNDLSVTGSINGTGLTNTATNGNLTLTPYATGQVQIVSGKTLATDVINTNTATAIAVKNNMTFDATKTLTVDNIISKSISNNGNITSSKLLPNDLAGLQINLDTCTLTCADSVQFPQIIINPQLQVNGTLACTAGMSLSGGDLMVWSKITTPYAGSATDLQLNPSGNVRVIGNKTLFCNAISQNDTNTDLYLTAGGTNQNVVLSPAGTGQVQVLTGKTLSADNIVTKTVTVNGTTSISGI